MSKGVKETVSFESAMSRLEEIVGQMESADLPLDKIIDKYEEGMKLLGFCEQKLQAAEKKIELLTRNKDGKWQRAESDPAGAEEPGQPEKSGGEDVSLF